MLGSWADFLPAQALRDYETLSVNAISTIPIGACLVGSMEFAGEQQREGIAERVARFIPGLEVFASFLTTTSVPVIITINALRLILDAPSTDVNPSTAIRVIENICGNMGFRELDQQGRLRRAERKALTQRILMGLFGGIALICPVLVMVLYPSRNTNLITVSVATILFVSLLAIGASDSTGKDVLASLYGCAGCIFRHEWEFSLEGTAVGKTVGACLSFGTPVIFGILYIWAGNILPRYSRRLL